MMGSATGKDKTGWSGVGEMLTDITFAKRIIDKYKRFGGPGHETPSLVFLKEKRQEVYQVFLGSLQRETERFIHTKLVKETNRLFQQKLTQETSRFQKELMYRAGLLFNRSQTFYHRGALSGMKASDPARLYKEKHYQEFQVFHSISTIFANRDRQPDVAKKAERKLIRILSEDFFESNFKQKREIELRSQFTYMNKNEYQKEWETKEYLVKRQTSQEDELGQSRHLLNALEERLAVHEKVLKEFRQTKDTVVRKHETRQIDQITKEVIKKMEQELHLEKLRRGF